MRCRQHSPEELKALDSVGRKKRKKEIAWKCWIDNELCGREDCKHWNERCGCIIDAIRPVKREDNKKIKRYSVDYGVPGSVGGANTIEDLHRYLDGDPMPMYRMVSCQFSSGYWIIVWELKG